MDAAISLRLMRPVRPKTAAVQRIVDQRAAILAAAKRAERIIAASKGR